MIDVLFRARKEEQTNATRGGRTRETRKKEKKDCRKKKEEIKKEENERDERRKRGAREYHAVTGCSNKRPAKRCSSLLESSLEKKSATCHSSSSFSSSYRSFDEGICFQSTFYLFTKAPFIQAYFFISLRSLNTNRVSRL